MKRKEETPAYIPKYKAYTDMGEWVDVQAIDFEGELLRTGKPCILDQRNDIHLLSEIELVLINDHLHPGYYGEECAGISYAEISSGEQRPKTNFRCIVCKSAPVNPFEGFDTCEECAKSI